MSKTGEIIRGAGGHLKRNLQKGVGIGNPHGGEEGEIRVQMVDGSPHLFAKAGGTWYGVSLKDEAVSELKIGSSTNYIEFDPTVGINIINNSTDVASLGKELRIGQDSTDASALRVTSVGAMSIGVKDGTPQFEVAADGTVSFGGELTTAVDLSGITEASIAAGDYFVFFDGGDDGPTRKDNINDLATLFAGDGLTASSGIMAVNVDDSSIETNSDAIRVKSGGISNSMLAGSIANAKLSNSSVSFGGVSLSLGGSDADPAFDLSDANSYPGDSSLVTTGTIGSGTWRGTVVELLYGGTELVGATDGKIVIADGSGAPVHLDVGSSTAITILGTVATGTWEATDVGVAHGGTGLSTVGTNEILTGNGTGALTSESNLTYTSGTFTFGNATSIVTSGGDLTLVPAGDIVLNPTGNDILPTNNYDLNIGSVTNKYLALHCAELRVDTLVAADVLSTIGGRIVVAPTTELILGINASVTQIDVKHNNLTTSDIIFMQKAGQFEAILIGSTATEITGGYRYTSCTRGYGSSGGDSWVEGDALLNTGTTNDGFIDLYADHAINVSANIGPTIVGNVRTGTAIGNYEPMWAIGNLRGLYGKANDADTPGVGIGKWSADSLIATGTDIKFYNAGTVTSEWDATSIALGGDTDAVANCVQINLTGVKIYNNATNFASITSTGLKVYSGSSSATVAEFGTTTYIGAQANEHIKLTDSSMQFFDGATQIMALEDGIMTMAGQIILNPGSSNIVIGQDNSVLGEGNIVFGYRAGWNLVTHNNSNALIGYYAGGSIGKSGAAAEQGSYNSCLGDQAGWYLEKGSENAFFGHNAGRYLMDGNRNTAVGVLAGQARPDEAVTGNTAVGYRSGWSNEGGSYNVAVGYYADHMHSGGIGNGSHSFSVSIGYQADTLGSNAVAIGSDIQAAADTFRVGKSSNYISAAFSGTQTFTVSSDRRKKRNINDNVLGLEFIDDIKTKTFQFRPSNEFPEEWEAYHYDDDDNKVYDTIDTEMLRYGLIAQEVKESMVKFDADEFPGWNVDNKGIQEVSKESFVIPLIKAVQELSAKVTALEAQI